MVIRVPKIIKTALSLCERPYSILGFGDILLPGKYMKLEIISRELLHWQIPCLIVKKDLYYLYYFDHIFYTLFLAQLNYIV